MRLQPLQAAAALLVVACGCDSTPTTPVPSPPLSAIEVSPDTDTLRVGESLRFTGTAYDTLGAIVGGVGFQWRSRDPNVFTVNSFGTVSGVGEGAAWLVASAGGASDSAWVAVTPMLDGWFAQPSAANGANLRGVFFQPDGRRGWAVGDAGKIVHTADGGATWAPQASRTTFTLHDVWFTGPNEGWAVGNNGTALHTTDGGNVWERDSTGTAESLRGVCFATRDTGWAVGSNGVILRTFDRGASWQKTFPTAATLHGVSFAGTRDGWAVGDGVIVGTHDRGLTWFVVQPTVTASSLRDVWRRSEAMAAAVGAAGAAPITVAGPDSTAWLLMSAGGSNQLEGAHFPTDLVGFAVGYNGVGAVLRTTDGGLTWSEQAANADTRLNDVFFVDERRGWAVGDGGRIIHTGTGGELP